MRSLQQKLRLQRQLEETHENVQEYSQKEISGSKAEEKDKLGEIIKLTIYIRLTAACDFVSRCQNCSDYGDDSA